MSIFFHLLSSSLNTKYLGYFQSYTIVKKTVTLSYYEKKVYLYFLYIITKSISDAKHFKSLNKNLIHACFQFFLSVPHLFFVIVALPSLLRAYS